MELPCFTIKSQAKKPKTRSKDSKEQATEAKTRARVKKKNLCLVCKVMSTQKHRPVIELLLFLVRVAARSGMARQSLALVVLSATLACALDINAGNGSGRGLGFTWHGGLLRPHACRHAPCASVCSHPCGVALCLRQTRRAHQAACAHAHGHGHSHGEPAAAHDADCCGHVHASGEDNSEHVADAGTPKTRHHVMLVMDAAGGAPAADSDAGESVRARARMRARACARMRRCPADPTSRHGDLGGASASASSRTIITSAMFVCVCVYVYVGVSVFV